MSFRPSARLALAASAGLSLSLLSALPANAHGSAGAHALGGALHPLLGLDHLLMLFTVGLAAQALGAQLLWAALAGGVTGSVFGISGAQLPMAELFAALAVSATALLLLRRSHTSLAAGGIVALAVAVHALLHGQEALASPAWWIAALASSSLVVGLGLLCGRRLAPLSQRRLAVGLGLSGLVLASLQALG